MPLSVQTSCTAFARHRRLASGPLPDVALAVKAALEGDPAAPDSVLTFDDSTGRVVDLDLRGSRDDVLARLAADPPAGEAPRGRGRPRLGVVAREVTLLPRHWEWLNAQAGGASVALRKLVETAMRDPRGRAQDMREAAYRFMSAMAGDMPGFEEATRALFADDHDGMRARMAAWPPDIRDHALKLAFGDAPRPA
ncbi:DUF2239 family protein [Bordetella flabilis]|uniref:DUF2239 domain-containing protein n=1 Tax=Bordetella flabilis TaxID=463014 RepID=A0A193GBG5_9BORD|nr:DUF2239 family protein [Bordetella flabilis]ANN76619.1 hypothetical protein BAU07_05340 [Bordetella flabilis]